MKRHSHQKPERSLTGSSCSSHRTKPHRERDLHRDRPACELNQQPSCCEATDTAAPQMYPFHFLLKKQQQYFVALSTSPVQAWGGSKPGSLCFHKPQRRRTKIKWHLPWMRSSTACVTVSVIFVQAFFFIYLFFCISM